MLASQRGWFDTFATRIDATTSTVQLPADAVHDDGFSLGAVGADRDPSPSFATGQRIETVVGDHIEAGLAFNDVSHRSHRGCHDAPAAARQSISSVEAHGVGVHGPLLQLLG